MIMCALQIHSVSVIVWLQYIWAGSCVGRQVLEETLAVCNDRVHEVAPVLQRKDSEFSALLRPPRWGLVSVIIASAVVVPALKCCSRFIWPVHIGIGAHVCWSALISLPRTIVNEKVLMEFKHTLYCCCLNLWPWNLKTMSFRGYPKVVPIPSLNTLWSFKNFRIIINFLISVKMHLLTLWPWPLTFLPQNHF